MGYLEGSPLVFEEQRSALQFALVGFLVAVVVGVVTELLLFEGDLVEASITAGAIGIGVGIGLFVFESTRT